MVISQPGFLVGAEELPNTHKALQPGYTLTLHCRSYCDKVRLAFYSVGGDTFSLGLTVAAVFALRVFSTIGKSAHWSQLMWWWYWKQWQSRRSIVNDIICMLALFVLLPINLRVRPH